MAGPAFAAASLRGEAPVHLGNRDARFVPQGCYRAADSLVELGPGGDEQWVVVSCRDDADWSASWGRTTVTDAEWVELRAALAGEAHRWLAALGTEREVSRVELNGVVGSIAHLAYHLGAIRQIDPGARGPAAND